MRTATHGAKKQVPLDHTAWPFDGIPRTLDTGDKVWCDADVSYTSVPAGLEGVWFWPGLGRARCPLGSLLLAPSIDGEVYVWGRADTNGGGIESLDDVSGNVRSLAPSTVLTSGGASYSVFRRIVPAECRVEIPTTTAWTGGVAFVRLASLPAQRR